MVSVVSDSRIPQLFRPYAGRVSRACWPRQVRRCVATGRMAQRRRLLIMRGYRWPACNAITATRIVWRLSLIRVFYMLSLLLVLALFVESILLLVYVMRPWALLLLLTMTWAVALALAMRLLQNETVRSPLSYKPRITLSLEPKRQPLQPVEPQFPRTPMPATPLVRVLETIDLSTSPVEHFVDPALKQEEQIPHSQLSE